MLCIENPCIFAKTVFHQFSRGSTSIYTIVFIFLGLAYSLSVMSSKSIDEVTNGSFSFFLMAEQYSTYKMHILLFI